MTREAFIKKWLGNNNFQYCEEHKELMREDLDGVIEYAQQQVNSVDLADVVGRSEQLCLCTDEPDIQRVELKEICCKCGGTVQ